MRTFHLSGALAVAVILFITASSSAAAVYESPETLSIPVQWGKVDENLLESLSEVDDDVSVEFVLRLSDRASIEDVRFQREEVVYRLKTTAAASQARVLSQLEERGFAVKKSFWITNALLVDGPAGQVGELTKLPEVHRIVDNFEVTLMDGEPAPPRIQASAVTWGLEKVGADRVWSEIGVRGDGVRVCVSDTGVDITHPDLDGKMWSDAPGDPEFPGGWIEFDFSGNPVLGSAPHDTQGHGTHTSGTVLGGEASGVAIGMAPTAVLMHALVLPGGSGSFAQVIAGIEWCVNPIDDQGNPAGQPADVHSMSWGATGYFDEMVEPIRNSYFAGTVPVAAAGNCGEGCTGTPGNIYDSLGIGASDVDDLIAYFSSGELVSKSSWGSPPADWPDEWVVPLLSAPGVDVYSSLPGGGYEEWSGTSMATPHVAGCAALMLSANSGLSPDDIRDTMVATAVWYNTYYPSPPDTRYGWGRLDCFTAVETVAYNSGITGTVRDQEDGAFVDQAQVNVSGPGIARRVVSDSTGSFKLSLKPGAYNLSVERFGYSPQSVSGITVEENLWVDLDILLSPLPRGNITGTAFNNATGVTVPGVTVTLLNIPIKIAATTDQTGTFALTKIPEGSYDLLASSPYFIDLEVKGTTVVQGSNVTVDFPLTASEWVAVMGDEGESLSSFLRENGYYVENPEWTEVISDPCRYRTVVVNHPWYPGSTTFDDFLTATDAVGTGVVFLDTWEHTYTGGGIYYMWYYRADPASRDYGYDSSAEYTYYRVNVSHPVLGSNVTGDVIVYENSTYWHDYAWFDQYTGENGTVIAQAGTSAQGDLGPGIAVDERANNRHVLLSLHGASTYVQPKDWTSDAAGVFLNAVNWSKGTACPNPTVVDFDIQVDPPVGLWYQTFTVSVGAKNVGSATANYTARLYVDDWLEAEQTVSLLPGELKTVSFNVGRDAVGSYRVSIGPHTSSFKIRPPRVTVQAYDLEGMPLTGGIVEVGLGSSLLKMGETDGNGTVDFDSPGGSHGQYWIVLQANDIGSEGTHYFLAKDLLVEYDMTTSFSPTANSTAVLQVQMERVVNDQEGVVYLRRDDMPDAFADDFQYPEGSILVDPVVHVLSSVMTVDTLRNTWTYQSSEVSLDFASLPYIEFWMGGRLRAEVSWNQSDTSVTVDWDVFDRYDNEVISVAQKRVGILQAGETLPHTPFLSLWNPQGTVLASGYVEWYQKPANATVGTGETVAHVQLDLETGPYAFDNTFELTVEVVDSGGSILPSVASTADRSVLVRGSALLYGKPVPVNLTINDRPTAVDANGTFSLTVNLTKGLNNVTVVATDLVGNERSRVFIILSKPDILLMLRSLPGITNVPEITLEGMVELEALLTVNEEEVLPAADGSFSFTLTLGEGLNTIVVAAEDFLGSRKEIVKEVTLDTIAPDITIVSPQSGEVTRDENVTIVGTTEPTANLTINGQPVELDDGLFTYDAGLEEGENTFVLEAADGAGNVQTTTLTIHRELTVMGVPLTPLLYIIPAAAAAAGLLLFFLYRRTRPPEKTTEEAAEEEIENLIREKK
ncbi:MAG: S8 family serine peptidase [Thermoplasmata archaeon]